MSRIHCPISETTHKQNKKSALIISLCFLPWLFHIVTAAIAVGKRPVPFRTQKLSLPAPMVLHPNQCGRVGHRRTQFANTPYSQSPDCEYGVFCYPQTGDFSSRRAPCEGGSAFADSLRGRYCRRPADNRHVPPLQLMTGSVQGPSLSAQIDQRELGDHAMPPPPRLRPPPPSRTYPSLAAGADSRGPHCALSKWSTTPSCPSRCRQSTSAVHADLQWVTAAYSLTFGLVHRPVDSQQEFVAGSSDRTRHLRHVECSLVLVTSTGELIACVPHSVSPRR